MNRIITCCTILLLAAQMSSAQTIKNFSEDPAKYKEELRSFLSAADKKKTEQIFLSFESVWVSMMNEAQKNRVIEVSNVMLKKRFKAYPVFEDYLLALSKFHEKNISSESIDAWQDAIVAITKKSSRKGQGNGKVWKRAC